MTTAVENMPVCELTEWSSACVPHVELSDEDRGLLARWKEPGEQRLIVEELRDCIQVRTRSWVGVVRFSSFEIRIVPKLAGEHLGLLKLLDYASGLDAFRKFDASSSIEMEGNNLFDLVAFLFAEACEQLVRRGILADYREVEDDLPVVRGRLLASKQFLRRCGNFSRLECRYDNQVSDIAENQLLLEALSSCRSHVSNLDILRRINRLETVFSSVCSRQGFSEEVLRCSPVYNRRNEHYRESHEFALLILKSFSVSNILGKRGVRCFAFLLDMNVLFEQFLTRWLSELLVGTSYSVSAQHKDTSVLWDMNQNRSYAGVIPDFLVMKEGLQSRRLPIDAKYKLYDEKKVGVGDIYQTFLYAHAFGGGNPGYLPKALILYPASDTDGKILKLAVRKSNQQLDAEVLVLGIHIPSALAENGSKAGDCFGDVVLQAVEKCF